MQGVDVAVAVEVQQNVTRHVRVTCYRVRADACAFLSVSATLTVGCLVLCIVRSIDGQLLGARSLSYNWC